MVTIPKIRCHGCGELIETEGEEYIEPNGKHFINVSCPECGYVEKVYLYDLKQMEEEEESRSRTSPPDFYSMTVQEREEFFKMMDEWEADCRRIGTDGGESWMDHAKVVELIIKGKRGAHRF